MDNQIRSSLIHIKDANGEEIILFPYTRYDNILGAPKVVKNTDDATSIGAPFILVETDTVDVDISVMTSLYGGTIINT